MNNTAYDMNEDVKPNPVIELHLARGQINYIHKQVETIQKLCQQIHNTSNPERAHMIGIDAYSILEICAEIGQVARRIEDRFDDLPAPALKIIRKLNSCPQHECLLQDLWGKGEWVCEACLEECQDNSPELLSEDALQSWWHDLKSKQKNSVGVSHV